MSVTICLLITDDPDDQRAFSEVLAHYADTVLLVVLESKMVVKLFETKKYSPDCIFIDLSMHGIKINALLKSINDYPGTSPVPIVVYGEDEDFNKIGNSDGLIFFSKDYEFSALKKFLSELINPQKPYTK